MSVLQIGKKHTNKFTFTCNKYHVCLSVCFVNHVPICKVTNISKHFNKVYDMINACKIHFNTHSNFYVRPLFTTDIHNVLQMKKNTLYLHYNGSYNENIQILCIQMFYF